MRLARLFTILLLASACPMPHAEPSAVTDQDKILAMVEQITARREQDFIARLPALKVESLYILDPSAKIGEDTQVFHDWAIAAEGGPLPSDLAQDALKIALRDLVLSGADGEAMCFNPRHAMVMSDGTHRYDILVCFECSKYEIHTAAGLPVSDSFSLRTEATWDRAFGAAGLRRGSGQREK